MQVTLFTPCYKKKEKIQNAVGWREIATFKHSFECSRTVILTGFYLKGTLDDVFATKQLLVCKILAWKNTFLILFFFFLITSNATMAVQWTVAQLTG